MSITYLLATDADWIRDDVAAAVGDSDTVIKLVRAGRDVVPAVEELRPDLVILDLQLGNMGGMAACMNLRLEAGAGRLPDVTVLMLLDRQADVFLAQRCDADGWLIKPLDSFRLRRAVAALRRGEQFMEGLPAELATDETDVSDDAEGESAGAEPAVAG
ncbi:MAG: putative two-component response regulator [Acidimicrobiia bacterium]|nr:putative two-component response regulator [Acidimicrobiia bacterium]